MKERHLLYSSIIAMLLTWFVPSMAYAQYKDGDEFTAQTIEGIDMTFSVISADEKTCSVDFISRSVEGYVTIPEVANGFIVVKIGNGAFYGCSNLTSITIPNSVTEICWLAFKDCSGLTSITIPNSVTEIGSYAFSGCSGLTTVTIGNSVTEIGSYAFSGCSGLTSITLPNSVTEIGDAAFAGCDRLSSITIPASVVKINKNPIRKCPNLTSIKVDSKNLVFDSRDDCNAIIATATNEVLFGCKTTKIPSTVTRIRQLAFYGVLGLTEISIPSSVTRIDGAAFYWCYDLKSLTIPRNVNDLGKVEGDEYDDYTPYTVSPLQMKKAKGNINIFPFAIACSSLTSLRVEEGNATYDSRDNCNAIIETASNTLLNGCMNTTIPHTVTSIGRSAFSELENLETIEIPNSIVNIGDEAFLATGLTNINLPNSIINIGEGAFEETELTEVVIPNSVVNIGEDAFNGCDKLTTVYIPNSVKNIGDDAFNGGGDEGIKDIYSKINEPFIIDEYVFSYSTYKNGTLHVPYGLIEKYKAQEGWNKFVNIVEPRDGTVFKERTIEGVEMTFTIISAKDKTCSVGTSSSAPAISNTTTGAVTVPDFADEYKVISVGEYAFLGCTGVTAVNLPASVVTLDDDSFRGCTSLTSFTVSESISYIGRRAFANCINLKDVYSEITNPFAIWDDSFPYDIATLHVPQGTKAKYKATKGWKNFKTIDSGVLEDGDVFAIQTKEGVYLACQVINWQEKTCRVGDEETHDSALYSFDENDNPIEFEGDLTIPEKAMGYTIIRIETNALRRYKKLENVVIPNTVKSIGNYAFSECESLKEIILPNGLMEVGERAFNGCTSLQTVVIPNSVKSIGKYAFANCMGLYAVTSLVNIPFILDDSAFAIESNDYDRDIMYGIAKLYVPMGRASIYQQTTGWKKFLNIVEKTMSNKLTYMLDGVVYKTFDVQPGEVVTPEPDPVREGYDFSGWQGVPIIMPDHDVVVYGYFVPGDGISNIPVTKTMDQGIYNLSGQRVTHPHKGIYIKGGKKVVIK